MDKHIWFYSFPMRKGILDDDYYFFEDGRILHCYDKTQSKLNIEEYVTADSIDLSKRQTMLNACHQELYQIIKQILQLWQHYESW